MLVEYNKDYRHSWMLPRNKRRIEPHTIALILCKIENNLANGNWSGNISNQKEFTKSLEIDHIKRAGEQIDENSGGARTYLNQLENLGLVFKHNGNYYLTISGEKIVQGVEPKKILQHNLLNLQYPSTYSKNRNCNINPKIKIKPFLMLLKILMDQEVKYLTNYEIILITVFGHNYNCIELCKKKIIELRKYDDPEQGLHDILSPFKNYIITPKTKENTTTQLINNLGDNANTFGNYLQSLDLVTETEKIKNKKTIIFNEEYSKIYQDHLKNINKFISFTNDQQFQRMFGKYDKKKDTRTIAAIQSIKSKISKKDQIIKEYFFSTKKHENITTHALNEKFYQDLYQSHGFQKYEINDILEPLIATNFDEVFRDFITISKSGKKYALEFEKKIKTIFQNYWGFETYHTGQKKRLKEGGGAYSDIFIINKYKTKCSIVDGKAINNYTLPNDDRLKMINSYGKNYKELENDYEYKNLKLGFILYVCGSINFRSKISENCRFVSKEMNNIPVSVISSFDFVSLAKKYKGFENQDKISEIFSVTGPFNQN